MHNLNKTASGEAAMAYTGATPWHRLGQVVEDPYDLEAGLSLAHADFEVETVPMYHNLGGPADPEITPEAIENRVVIRRADNLVPLGVATDRYKVMQTRDGMDFLKSLLGEGKVRLETIGVLGKGERVWVLAKLEGKQRQIVSDDVIEDYVMFALGHDGQFNFISMFTPIRIVCSNTLSGALRSAKQGECVKIRHTGDVQAKLRLAAELLSKAGVFFDEVTEGYRFLASKQIGERQLQSYMMEVCEQVVPYQDTSQKIKNRIELFTKAHDTGLGSDIAGVRGTLWGAYNAVTEVVDHRLAESNKDPIKYMGFGTGRDIKHRALKIALAHANASN